MEIKGISKIGKNSTEKIFQKNQVDLDGKGQEEEAKGTESKSTVSGVDTQSKLAEVCELTTANLLLQEEKEEKSSGPWKNKAGSKSAAKSIDTQPYYREASQDGSSRLGKAQSSVFGSEDSDSSLSKKSKRKEKKKHEQMVDTPRKSPRIKNSGKIAPPSPEPCDDGVTKEIAAKLKEAGLKHQEVAQRQLWIHCSILWSLQHPHQMENNQTSRVKIPQEKQGIIPPTHR